MITDEGTDVVPGSGELGRVAQRGRTPVGYYKDDAKSAQTFVMIDGDRYSIPGDYATVEADGTVTLLGRGSQCINTGGEKVYPEEVEECLKLHPSVADAAVVGLPDDKWGEAINALVEPHAHATLMKLNSATMSRPISPPIKHQKRSSRSTLSAALPTANSTTRTCKRIAIERS